MSAVHSGKGGRGGRGGKGGKGGANAGAGAEGTKVYVGNLSWETSWQDLKDHFRSVGEVLHADVMTGHDGRSKGCGLVTFAAAHDAARAIQTLHDSVLHSRSIFVREDREPGAGIGSPGGGFGGGKGGGRGGGLLQPAAGNGCQVFVGNLVSTSGTRLEFKGGT